MSDPLQKVREAALELPETEERLSHGQPTFFVAGKQFAQVRDNHHGDGKTVVCVRTTSLDEQAMLIASDPDTYSRPAYHADLGLDEPRGRQGRLGPCCRPYCGKLGACSAEPLARSWRAMTDEKTRRRWINLGELIALAALLVSALGVWIAWKSTREEKPTRVVEQRSAVPLALRGTTDSDGRTLTIMPADPSHALQSLTLTIQGVAPIEAGSDGRLSASELERALKGRAKEAKDVAHDVPVRIDARYVEAGADRRGGGTYRLRYKWEGGGLFGGRSLRLVSLSRS